MEESIAVPQKSKHKISIHYSRTTFADVLKRTEHTNLIFLHTCVQKFTTAKGGNNSKIHWQMNGYKQCCIDLSLQFSSVQSLSRVRLFVTPWIAAHQASLSITNSRSSPRLTSIESVMPGSHLILCRHLLFLLPIPPSISLFQWVNSSHEVAKVLEFQL